MENTVRKHVISVRDSKTSYFLATVLICILDIMELCISKFPKSEGFYLEELVFLFCTSFLYFPLCTKCLNGHAVACSLIQLYTILSFLHDIRAVRLKFLWENNLFPWPSSPSPSSSLSPSFMAFIAIFQSSFLVYFCSGEPVVLVVFLAKNLSSCLTLQPPLQLVHLGRQPTKKKHHSSLLEIYRIFRLHID